MLVTMIQLSGQVRFDSVPEKLLAPLLGAPTTTFADPSPNEVQGIWIEIRDALPSVLGTRIGCRPFKKAVLHHRRPVESGVSGTKNPKGKCVR